MRMRLLFPVVLFAILNCLLMSTVQAGVFGDRDVEFDDQDNQTVSRLLEAFSSGCSLTGGVATDAISVVRSLGEVMNSAAKDSRCTSLAGAVASLQSSHLQASSLWPSANESAYNEAQKEYSKYKNQKDQILLLLAAETDPAIRRDLQTQLRQIQIDMAGSEGSTIASLENDRRHRKSEAIRVLVLATNSAMEQAISNQECWVDKPDVLRQIVGLGSAVGYSTAAVIPSSTAALATGAGLQLIGGFWDFVKRLGKAKKVNYFTKSLDSIALTCALEKMNSIYCSALDTQNSLNVLAKTGTELNLNPVWQGVRFNRRELPVLIGWLEKMKSGAGGVSSPDDADKINSIEQRKQLLEQSPRYLQGYQSKYRPLFAQVSSVEAKFGILKDFISSLSSVYCPEYGNGMTSPNPLCRVYSIDFVPFYLLGLTRDQTLALKAKYMGLVFNFVDLQLLLKENILVDIDLEKVEPRFWQWYNLARQNIDAEASTVLGDDLKLVFEEALPQVGSDNFRLTPSTAMTRIIAYLNLPNPQRGLSDFEREIIGTLHVVQDNIRAVSENSKTPQDARDAIIAVTHLRSGATYLQNRIKFVLRGKLETLILAQGELPLQALAANDYIQELHSFYNAESLEIIRRKSLNAQATIQRSIDPFLQFFAQPLQESLNSFDRLAKKFKEGPGGPNYEMKMTMCFYLLGASQWSSSLDLSPCVGVQGLPVFEAGYSTPVFEKALFDRPYAERTCLLRDFNRRNQLLQSKLNLLKKNRGRR